LHPICQKCLEDREKRFRPTLGDGWNCVKCTYIPEDYLLGIDKTQYTEEQLHIMEIYMDPVKFAKYMFEITLRFYQDEMIRCTAIRKVSRCGRRIGKSWVLTISACWFCFIHKNKYVMVMTPRKDQGEKLYNWIVQWYNQFPQFRECIRRKAKNPGTIEFKNGSTLFFVTAGSSNNAKAGAARGQEADVIILDEADYLNPSDIDTVFPMLQRTDETSEEDKILWASSTPRGTREKFYGWAHSERFKEFHYPSWLNPAWDKTMEAELRDELKTNTAWEHEAAADWGLEMEGVFQHAFVDKAVSHAYRFFGEQGFWPYEESKRVPGCLYTIGVDWNSSRNGAQIVVMEFNSALRNDQDEASIKGRFRVATRVSIDATEFTQLKACQEIIRLNKLWKPMYIYVDQGYGTTQVEELRRYGLDHPEDNILEKLKAIDFGSSIEVHDPVNRTVNKRPMKPFLVNNAVEKFERDMVVLNPADSLLEDQIRAYTVEKQTRLGQPVYSAGYDHALDAFMLALLAFTMEFTDLGKPKFTLGLEFAENWRTIGVAPEPSQEEIVAHAQGLIPVPIRDINKLANGEKFAPAPIWGTGKSSEHSKGWTGRVESRNI